MAHFARVDENNLVTEVLVVDDKYEANGAEYLSNTLGLGGRWIRTSYNTYAGEHLGGKEPLRKNFAGIGFAYDEELDAFIPPRPFDSWSLNKQTCRWEPPVSYPADNKNYYWDEGAVNWIQIEEN